MPRFYSNGKIVYGSGRVRYGIGDVIANFMKSVGIEPCADCERRRVFLNSLPDRVRKKLMSVADGPTIEAREAICAACPKFYRDGRGVSRCKACPACATIRAKQERKHGKCPDGKW